jgi:hypothetical protein
MFGRKKNTEQMMPPTPPEETTRIIETNTTATTNRNNEKINPEITKRRNDIINYYLDNFPGGFHDPKNFGIGEATISDLLLALLYEIKTTREEIETLNKKITEIASQE